MIYFKKGNLKDVFDSKVFDDLFNLSNFVGNKMVANLIEIDDMYKLSIELPGINKEDIKITYEDSNLTVEVTKNEEVTEEKVNYLYKEVEYGKFERKFHIPDVNKDLIKANYNNGVLVLTLPKNVKEENIKYINIE